MSGRGDVWVAELDCGSVADLRKLDAAAGVSPGGRSSATVEQERREGACAPSGRPPSRPVAEDRTWRLSSPCCRSFHLRSQVDPTRPELPREGRRAVQVDRRCVAVVLRFRGIGAEDWLRQISAMRHARSCSPSQRRHGAVCHRRKVEPSSARVHGPAGRRGRSAHRALSVSCQRAARRPEIERLPFSQVASVRGSRRREVPSALLVFL